MPPAPNSDRQVGVIVRSAGKELASTLTFKEITKSRLKHFSTDPGWRRITRA
jgi:hypothetical protein